MLELEDVSCSSKKKLVLVSLDIPTLCEVSSHLTSNIIKNKSLELLKSNKHFPEQCINRKECSVLLALGFFP